jgi:hypothetical protein
MDKRAGPVAEILFDGGKILLKRRNSPSYRAVLLRGATRLPFKQPFSIKN